jgi:ribosomal protein L22
MTERNYNPNQKENKAMKKQDAISQPKAPVAKESVPEEKKVEGKVESPTTVAKTEIKDDITKTNEKKIGENVPKETKKKIKKIKKDTAIVNGKNLPISTKVGGAIGRFLKNKKIEVAIKDLEAVIDMKKAVPMRGEVPHRKGNIMSGRFPQKAAKEVIILLNSLKGNTLANDMDEPIIREVISNQAARPVGKRGSTKKKRTHMTIIAKEVKTKKSTEKKETNNKLGDKK